MRLDRNDDVPSQIEDGDEFEEAFGAGRQLASRIAEQAEATQSVGKRRPIQDLRLAVAVHFQQHLELGIKRIGRYKPTRGGADDAPAFRWFAERLIDRVLR